MLSRELTNFVFANVAFGVSLTLVTGVRPHDTRSQYFLLRLGKCEIAQIGLGKCELAQKNCLILPKTANNCPNVLNKYLPQITRALPECRRKFAQILHKHVLLQPSKLTSKTITLSPRFRAISIKKSSLANDLFSLHGSTLTLGSTLRFRR